MLITGESGTGKELLARAIHDGSARAQGPFVAVNCAAIPSGLVASELFGHEKGAFTGAAARNPGQIEMANSGTLFLDEIGDMPIGLQGHLLRFLQEGQIRRLGGRETLTLDVRIVSATNVRLVQAISEGRFREDLYYRLNVLTLPVPPLRDRKEDVAQLAHHFLRVAAQDFNRPKQGFTAEAMAALLRHRWPGNVRELMSVVRRAVVVGDGHPHRHVRAHRPGRRSGRTAGTRGRAKARIGPGTRRSAWRAGADGRKHHLDGGCTESFQGDAVSHAAPQRDRLQARPGEPPGPPPRRSGCRRIAVTPDSIVDQPSVSRASEHVSRTAPSPQRTSVHASVADDQP